MTDNTILQLPCIFVFFSIICLLVFSLVFFSTILYSVLLISTARPTEAEGWLKLLKLTSDYGGGGVGGNLKVTIIACQIIFFFSIGPQLGSNIANTVTALSYVHFDNYNTRSKDYHLIY